MSEAVQAINSSNGNKVKELRKSVSMAIRNDPKIKKELCWTSGNANFGSHYKSLIGIHINEQNQLNVDDWDIEELKRLEEYTRSMIPSDMTLVKGWDPITHGNVDLSKHHLIPFNEIMVQLKEFVKNNDNATIKNELNKYLNDPKNIYIKNVIINSCKTNNKMEFNNFMNENRLIGSQALIKSILWNNNNLGK